jgi:hypothetical protein
MLPDSPQQECVVNVIKQSFDIKLQNPVISPASLTRDTNSIERGFPGRYP